MTEQLIDIICEYIDTDPAAVTPAASLRLDLGATSFDLMNVAVAVENGFGVRVPDDRLPAIKTVGDILALLSA